LLHRFSTNWESRTSLSHLEYLRRSTTVLPLRVDLAAAPNLGGVLRDRSISLGLIFGCFAAVALLSVFIVLRIKPQPQAIPR